MLFTEIAAPTDGSDAIGPIQDFLDSPTYQTGILPDGDIRVSQAPVIPSFKRLGARSRLATSLLPYRVEIEPGVWEHQFARTPETGGLPALLASVLDVEDSGVFGLTIDNERMNNGLGDILRTHGLMIQRGHDFFVDRVRARGVYGYALYHENPLAGAHANGTLGTNVRFSNCLVEDSQVDYECTGLDGFLIDNCHGRPGANLVALAEMFTFYEGSRNVTVRNCTGYGDGIIALPSSVGGDLENINFLHSRFVRTGQGKCLVTAGENFIDGLNLVGMTIISEDFIAAELSYSRGIIDSCRFVARCAQEQVGIIAVNVGPTADYSFGNTEIVCETSGAGSNATALAVANPTPFSGRLEASATGAGSVAHPSAGPVAFGSSTLTIPGGRRQIIRSEASGQASIIADQTGTSKVNFQLPLAVVDVAKVHLSLAIRSADTVTPLDHASWYARVYPGDLNVYVRILGDHSGRTLMWAFRELY